MIRVEFADPGMVHIETASGDWFIAAENAGRLESELGKPAFLALEGKDQVERLGGLADGGVLVFVPNGKSPAWFYRTINSTRELYFHQDDEGNWFFSDHFRNILASVPAGERRVEENALLDHLLFQYPAEASTRVRGVRRLAAGEILCVDTGNGKTVCRLAEKTPCVSREPGFEGAVSALEEALGSILEGSLLEECTLFSGGVDSALIQAFRPPGSKALSVLIDSPEFAFESEFAGEAARLLDAGWSHVSLKEEDYRGLFEECVEKAGQPVNLNFQPVFLYRAFQAPFKKFWLGDGSDTLFGHSQNSRILAFPGKEQFAESLAEPFDSPRGYAAIADLSPDAGVIRDLFGEEAVASRVSARLAHFIKRVSPCPGSREEQHAAMTSLVEFLGRTGEATSRKRQTATLFGREARTPFFSREILGLATSIPANRRFILEGEVKPIPKAVLRKKAPGYPFFGKKGGSDVPRTRYCQAGPFRDFFRDTILPEFLPSPGKALVENPEREWSFLTLAAASFSVWQERVLKAQTLERVPGTRVFEFRKKDGGLPGEGKPCPGK